MISRVPLPSNPMAGDVELYATAKLPLVVFRFSFILEIGAWSVPAYGEGEIGVVQFSKGIVTVLFRHCTYVIFHWKVKLKP